MGQFLLGLFTGGTIGFFLAALCNIVSKEDLTLQSRKE